MAEGFDVAFIGLGVMGFPMAGHLAQAGHRVTVYNRTAAKAQDWVSGQITRFGTQIVGVVAANDGTGGGAISAFKAAGVTPVPPVTGNDFEVAAAQRICPLSVDHART